MVNETEISVVPDINTSLMVSKTTTEAVARMFGPVFTKNTIKYTLEFEAEKLGENPPENIETLEGAVEYIQKNIDRYPDGVCSIVYGMAKSERMLEGYSASGSKRMAFNAVKKVMEESGMLSSLQGSTDQIFDAIVKFHELNSLLKVIPPNRFVREENGAKMIVKNCTCKDACRKLAQEDFSRIVGGKECIILINHCAAAEIITGKRCDYTLEKFDQPTCEGKIYLKE